MNVIINRWYANRKWKEDVNSDEEWSNQQNDYFLKIVTPMDFAEKKAKEKMKTGDIYCEKNIFKPIIEKIFPFGSSANDKTNKCLVEYEFILNKFREEKNKEKEIIKKLEKTNNNSNKK